MRSYTELAARILMAHIFLLAGVNKISGYAATQGYMEAMGVPGMLLPLVIALEIVGGLALILGFKTQWAAIALAGFTGVAAVLFHANLSDQMQMILFMKNWTIVGGLFLLVIYGAGELSLDHKFSKE